MVGRNNEEGFDLVLLKVRVAVCSIAIFHLMMIMVIFMMMLWWRHESSLMIFHLVVSIEVHERLWRDVNSSGEARALHDVGQRHIVWPFGGDDNNAINWNGTLEKWEMIAFKAVSMISVDDTNPF